MAITKQDMINLLLEIKATKEHPECDAKLKELLKMKSPSIDTIKYVYDIKGFQASEFYEKCRKSYNNGKSKLYINIVNVENLSPNEVLTCLASLNLQILLFKEKLEGDVPMFLRQVRFEEIQKAMLIYATSGDIVPCQKLLTLFKADLKVFETFKKDE